MTSPDIDVGRRDDGSLVLRSRQALNHSREHTLGAYLQRWAAEAPDRVVLAERSDAHAGKWRAITYRDALAAAESIGEAFLERGLGQTRPVMVLSGNSVAHGLFLFAGYISGVPIVPVSVPYSLQSRDFRRLAAIAELVDPGMVFAESGTAFAGALRTLRDRRLLPEVVTSSEPPEDVETTQMSDLLAVAPADRLQAAQAAMAPDTIAKVLFTSGSTGEPKGVINTHRMLIENQESLASIWPFTARTAPVLCDWLPWSHTFGANHNLNLVLKHGGSLYIDGGRPVPGQIETTIENMADVAPTIWFNVPAGYAAALPHLEDDLELAAAVLRRVQLIFYAAAALPQDVWDRLEALSVKAVGEPIPMTASWGTTETGPLATSAHFPLRGAGNIGVPVPGVEVKLVPTETRLELRVRGGNVTPGYWRRDDLTERAFDEEGYYRTGDAAKLADPADPTKGLIFDGRIAEDFKLTSGTWVHVGKVRLEALAAASPLLQDVVIAGPDRDRVTMLAWLNVMEAARFAGVPADAAAPSLARDPAVVEALQRGLRRYNQEHSGSSSHVTRLLILTEPPSIDDGEITDKGYINQRRLLELRAAEVEKLYAAQPGEDVILITGVIEQTRPTEET
jgi:feruloyl-CoA synthase